MTCYMHRPSFLWILLAPHPPPKFNNCAVKRNELLLARRAYARGEHACPTGYAVFRRFLVVGAIHDGANTRENASTAIQQHNHTATLAPNSDDQAWAVLMLARLSGEAISSGYGLRGSVLRRSRRFEPSCRLTFGLVRSAITGSRAGLSGEARHARHRGRSRLLRTDCFARALRRPRRLVGFSSRLIIAVPFCAATTVSFALRSASRGGDHAAGRSIGNWSIISHPAIRAED